MTTSSPLASSSFSTDFLNGITTIQSLSPESDGFHKQLYFSNIISLMEKYLSDLFIHEITSKDNIFNLMTSAHKFQSQKYVVKEIFNGDVKTKVINSVKNLVWHRINDIDPLFKHTLNIRMNINTGLTDKLTLRHDLIHRNGFTIDGLPVEISNDDLNECINVVSQFINDVESKYQNYLLNYS
ncbi:hypothetical protein H4J51_17465 [Colwellia sp. MB02u-18]|uniref:hypothetical protein n=1 Tax=unclassified Colwellia TaxID=196834 RepID=UPI0015F6DE8F|nr:MULTISPECIES: hypothetical protein [unclassified Colwellia]MBA6222612.1 hypothetical protein [Colwellia sp. MB3u-45]MBA6266469.1 hypothetical protein [Colwellia sp. MB3u-43]MBA6322654.1 hypothetical protein [Colwellia sp. MB02u-19]MBA6326352.1 hypothetical protein [Colwellia sp. MB02u-18]MBA6332965.1 hypothetical protein [Colwellia sp. MB02u-12]